MKRTIINSALITTIILGGAQFAMTACADNLPYEPIFESVPISEPITTTAKAEPATVPAVTKVSPVKSVTTAASPEINAVNTVESGNLQNALMQLDSAQVEIRNQLLQYRSEYTDIDNQYKTIKQQRKLKNKQVKETEKKIKNLDSTKEKIRKSM